MVRMAVFRARLGIGSQSLPRHVQPDRARGRDCLRLSLAATFVPGSSRKLAETDGTVRVYYEAAAVIDGAVLLGQVLVLWAREDRARYSRAANSCPDEDGAPHS